MARLSEQRRRFTMLAIGMGLICLLATLYLLAPFTASSEQTTRQLLEKQQALRAAEEQTRPIQQLPQLVTKAKSDIGRFYSDRLPGFPSAVYNSVYELAQKNRVSIAQVKYEAYDSGVPELQLMEVQAEVSGSYANIVRFINAVERSKLFFVINEIELGEARGENAVQLSVRMETYLRPRAAGEVPPGTRAERPTVNQETE